ncbi:hypoxanthine phosphoribosyltransferase [Microvenator marinus]|jgi:hypoxanthine phosphoribosyltransferase|uniref:Hypoxanthine phosphoribosyltransferase n=1 Tax=Microvenator marinus TaxID=2600177 RepID=A0A5B8XLZ9_9DELT|nr:hypoxanthine phosphoribosyltransferase [Microvenator marinus]QED25998.1 hypoxanthine phosphoribosyltransferase [Microvenator marinus]
MIERDDLDVLLSTEEINTRTKELAALITEEFKADNDLHVICVLKGSFLFFADLVREIELDLTVDFLGLSSYGDSTESSGVVRLTQDLSKPIKGRNVLIVEDIIDTGLTMKYLVENLSTRGPKCVKVCTLLHKPDNRTVEVQMDYIGFEIPNEFVIGYGLDYAEKFRNLPFIGVVRKRG